MSKPIVAEFTVKYHRPTATYRVLSPAGEIVDRYTHDVSDFQARRAMWRLALEDASVRNEAAAQAEGRAWADAAETRTEAEQDADNGRDRDAVADEAPASWETSAAVSRFQLVRTPDEILLVDTHDGRVVERFAADSAALAQEEADLLNRNTAPNGARVLWRWQGTAQALGQLVAARRSEAA